VSSGSAAEKAGIKAGDVIIKVDDTKVVAAGEITRALRADESKDSHKISLVREKKEMTVTVTADAIRRPRARSVRAQDFRF